MKCKKCKRNNEKNSNFCKYCGEKLNEKCNCWIKKQPYNCSYKKCPGYRLLLKTSQDK